MFWSIMVYRWYIPGARSCVSSTSSPDERTHVRPEASGYSLLLTRLAQALPAPAIFHNHP